MAAAEVFANQAQTTVTIGGTTAPSQGTSETWTVASSAAFPAVSSGVSQFRVCDRALPSEVMLVTIVSGVTWTVTRGAEGTTPVAHSPGFTVFLDLTAQVLREFLQGSANLSDLASDSTARANLGLGSASTHASTDFDAAGAAAAVGGASSPDQVAALSAGLTGITGITALAAAIANRNAARVDIPVIGDSITEGEGATAFSSRWITQASRAIRSAYPTTAGGSSGGLGFIPIASTGSNSFTWPFTNASGTFLSDQPIGPVRSCASITSACTFTWTAPAGTTSVRIMYYANGDGEQFSYKIDSGSPVTVTDSVNTGDGALTTSISITAGHVLTIAWVSGDVFLHGLVHYAGDENTGITIHGAGHSGWQACETEGNAWNQNGYGVGFPWQPSIAALIPQSGAVAIMLGVNDAPAYNAAGFRSNLETLMSGLRAYVAAPKPILLVIPYQANVSFVDGGGWPAYVAAIRASAATDSYSHVIDLSYRLPSIASGWDSGALYSDAYHPSDLGHALIGEIFAAGLRIA